MPTVLGAPVPLSRLFPAPPTHTRGAHVLALSPPPAEQPIWARPRWADFSRFPFAL